MNIFEKVARRITRLSWNHTVHHIILEAMKRRIITSKQGHAILGAWNAECFPERGHASFLKAVEHTLAGGQGCTCGVNVPVVMMAGLEKARLDKHSVLIATVQEFAMKKGKLRFIGWHVQFEFKIQDAWVGAFWKRIGNCIDLYICFLPFVPLHISWWWSREP